MTEPERYTSLMRYVDGEMTGEELVEVSAMLAGDRPALRTVEELRAGRALVRACFTDDGAGAQ
ncbi:MAG: hypothetical protein FJX56_12795, partial [Alphaproteobacteria bacterium]|nr:hypothetical protein [Alphaproteobacteria bacterium]